MSGSECEQLELNVAYGDISPVVSEQKTGKHLTK